MSPHASPDEPAEFIAPVLDGLRQLLGEASGAVNRGVSSWGHRRWVCSARLRVQPV